MTGILKFRFSLAIAAIAFFCVIPAWADPPSQVGRLSSISGAVSIRPASLNDWGPAALNYPLTAGDDLWADVDARAEVHVRSAAIRLAGSTEFSFVNLDDNIVQVSVSEGTISVNLRTLDQGAMFEIDTPNATVSLISAGSYRVDVNQNEQTNVTVRAGRADVTAGQDVYTVSAGQTSVIAGVDAISYYVTSAPRMDEWDSWSLARDRRDDQAAATQYVSRDMIGYEDLNESGSWRVVQGYGQIWTPSHVSSDWAPYRSGHWTWVAPWGWTWIDDASWGFAPFHYGRWAYLDARWVWIPGAVAARPVYAPALVVFVGGASWTPAGGDGIGWFPLGRGEVYIPPYQVSTAYVQRINVTSVVNINVQVIQNFNSSRVVYANRAAPRAVTVVQRQAFSQSRPVGSAQLSISSAELTRAPLMGMTATIAPQQASIIATPAASRAPVAQPARDVLARPVFSRTAPPAAPVPFVQQQKLLAARPGQPVDPSALSDLQITPQPAPVVVKVVNPATLNRPTVAVLKTPPPAAPAVVKAATPVAPNDSRNAAAQPNAMKASPKGAVANSQASASAAALIATLKTRTIPNADQALANARKVAGIKLDINATAQQLAAQKTALARAEKEMSDKNYAQALQDATAVQQQVDAIVQRIQAATQAGANVRR